MNRRTLFGAALRVGLGARSPGSRRSSRGAGAGLRSIMEIILLETMFELPSLHGVEKVEINKEVVAGSGRPVNVYARSARGDRAG